ncbi:MAG: hypothetical protein HPY83_06400, partial [Anaerolineae bacterium]|nr:hypothetical protein [Anaerolineae bacterium]
MKDTAPTQNRTKTPGKPTTNGLSDAARARGRAKSREARKAQREWAKANLRWDFLDAPHWAELARQYGVRLPQWWVPCTRKHMVRWLPKLGFSLAWYRDWAGKSDLTWFMKRNPDWPLRAFVGLLLEEREAESLP